jgi:mycothiol synthase
MVGTQPVKLRELTADDLAVVAGLCEAELILDPDAGAIPALLMQRPHTGLVAAGESGIAGVAIGSSRPTEDGAQEGFVDLLVVRRADQRQGIARQLVAELERRLAADGCGRVKIAGHPPRFAWPGIDIHYTAAICLAEDLGYRRGSCEVNMDIDLSTAPLDTAADAARLRAQGIEVRRAGPADDGPLQASLAQTWSPSWVEGVNRVREIGPVGTDPELRHHGVGRVLLRSCLAEQRDRGLPAAEIGWVGPLSYFARTVGATIGRAFWLYQKDLG